MGTGKNSIMSRASGNNQPKARSKPNTEPDAPTVIGRFINMFFISKIDTASNEAKPVMRKYLANSASKGIKILPELAAIPSFITFIND